MNNFIDINALKIILKIHKKIIKRDPGLILTQGIYLWPSTHVQDKREIPAIVNEKISDLVHDFMNFNALKIILKIH